MQLVIDFPFLLVSNEDDEFGPLSKCLLIPCPSLLYFKVVQQLCQGMNTCDVVRKLSRTDSGIDCQHVAALHVNYTCFPGKLSRKNETNRAWLAILCPAFFCTSIHPCHEWYSNVRLLFPGHRIFVRISKWESLSPSDIDNFVRLEIMKHSDLYYLPISVLHEHKRGFSEFYRTIQSEASKTMLVSFTTVDNRKTLSWWNATLIGLVVRRP